MRQRIFTLHIAVFCLVCIFACSSPEEKKERYYLKAMEYLKQQEPQSAIIELRNAIQLDPQFADARYQLGLLYLEAGEPQKAFQELIRAADLDPDNLDANLKAAEFYLISRKREKSRELVEKILVKEPTYTEGLACLPILN